MEDNQLVPITPTTPAQPQEFTSSEVMARENGELAIEEMSDYEEQKAQAGKAFNNNDRLQDFIMNHVMDKYDFVKVQSLGEHGTVFYRPRVAPNTAPTFTIRRTFKILRRADAERIVQASMQEVYHVAPALKVKQAVDTLLYNVSEVTENMHNELFEIVPGEYWDVAKAQVSTENPGSPWDMMYGDDGSLQYCMRSLFDSEGTNELSVDTSLFSMPLMNRLSDEVYRHLEANDGDIIPDDISGDRISSVWDLKTTDQPFAPFWTWANENIETFNDLLKAVASNFMEHKPKGAFVLIGLARNGKSTFIKMLHMLFGRNNTSMVRLADFNNHGLNGALWTTMMNAPDEEDEGTGNEILAVQSNFKSIAAHESLKLRRLYAQEGQWVNTDFMCFFPMNHFPEWKGSGATACMKRTLPLFFENDLSRYDNNGRDFAKDTFTGVFFQNLLAVVFAIAKYYKNRPLKFSEKMEEDKKRVAANVNNVNIFLSDFFSVFAGYSLKGLVYSEYQMWCVEHDLEPQARTVLYTALDMRPHGNHLHYESLTDTKAVKVISVISGREDPIYFYPECKLKELGGKTVQDVLMGDKDKYGHYIAKNERSVVTAILDLREQSNSVHKLAQERHKQEQLFGEEAEDGR